MVQSHYFNQPQDLSDKSTLSSENAINTYLRQNLILNVKSTPISNFVPGTTYIKTDDGSKSREWVISAFHLSKKNIQ